MKALLLAMLALLAGPFCAAQEKHPVPQNPCYHREQHILGIIPPYDVQDVGKFEPINSKQKFCIFANNTFDRFTPISAAADAALNQAIDTPAGYGQGGEAFAKRFGVAVADKVASNFFKQYMFPSLLHEDPRYFRLGPAVCGPAENCKHKSRFFYALSRVFVTRTDAGNPRFNSSEFLGSFAAAGLVNAYYPQEDRSATTTFERAAARIGLDAAVNVFKEFWPDVRGSVPGMRRKHPQP